MEDFIIARMIHVLAIVLWIGGVAFVTGVVMPAIRQGHAPDKRLAEFHKLEGRFALQARIWVLLAGGSGVWMVWRAHLWQRFAEAAYWWMIAMVVVWAIFATMLFILEPFVLHRRMAASPTPEADFRRMEAMHRILLAASLVTTAGAVGGSHGLW